jgi:hypothetical protein
MTAFAQAFKRAAFDPQKDEDYLAAVRILRSRNLDLKAATHFLASVLADMRGKDFDVGVQAKSESHTGAVAGTQSGEGESTGTLNSQARNGSPSPGQDRGYAVQAAVESHSDVGRVVPIKPNPPRGLAEMRRANSIGTPSRFDTYRLMDGRAIGDIPYGEWVALEARAGREAMLARLIRGHGVPANTGILTRDFIKETDLERMIQKAAELYDEKVNPDSA